MKNVLLICIGVVVFASIHAQIQGPKSPGSFSNSGLSGSDQSWINVSNVASSNDVYATFPDLADYVGAHTDYLVATNFGFSIPANAVLSGIVVEVERSDANQKTADYSIQLVKNGTIGSNDKSTGLAYPVNDTYQSYGGTNDLWGVSFSPADINASNFGVAVAAKRAYAGIAGGPTLGKIDHIRITVYYNFFSLPVTLIDFSLVKKINSVQLNWKTSDEVNMDHFEMERSGNGRDFITISSTLARNQNGINNYSVDDNDPIKGISYYRLKMVSSNATIKFSNVISVQFNSIHTAILYPSIWQKGLSLNVTNPNHETLSIYFFTETGQLIGKSVTHSTTVSTDVLSRFNGFAFYTVYDNKNEELGSGKMFVK